LVIMITVMCLYDLFKYTFHYCITYITCHIFSEYLFCEHKLCTCQSLI